MQEEKLKNKHTLIELNDMSSKIEYLFDVHTPLTVEYPIIPLRELAGNEVEPPQISFLLI